MNPRGPAAGFDWGDVLGPFSDIVMPYLPLFGGLIMLCIIVRLPLPGRGPGLLAGRDPWRGFKFQARRTVLTLAGNRCEGPLFVAWGRCRQPAQEVDHIYPWSKRGATVVSNGQALCTTHNRSKSNRTPPWWYVLSLERRRRRYYPPDASVTVLGGMRAADRAARTAWVETQPRNTARHRRCLLRSRG